MATGGVWCKSGVVVWCICVVRCVARGVCVWCACGVCEVCVWCVVYLHRFLSALMKFVGAGMCERPPAPVLAVAGAAAAAVAVAERVRVPPLASGVACLREMLEWPIFWVGTGCGRGGANSTTAGALGLLTKGTLSGLVASLSSPS